MRHLLASLALVILAPAAPLLAVDGHWQVLGPDGGTVNDLAFQPGSSQILYAAEEGGIYKSLDAGATWIWSGSGLDPRSQTLSVAVDPVHAGTVYAAQGGGISRSINGGRTWTMARGIPPAYQVAVHPQGLVFAATIGGLYRSADGGATWNRLRQGLPRSYSASLIAIDPATERRMYAWIQAYYLDTVGKLYLSTDRGATWQPLRRDPQGNQRISSLAVDPRARGTLYAGTDKAVYKSVDDGISWKTTGLSTAGLVWTLKIDPQTRLLYAGTQTGLFRSPDGGTTWRRLSQGLEGDTVHAVAFSPASPRILYTGVTNMAERGGVFRSANGGTTWTFSGRGISGLSIQSIAVDRQDGNTIWVTASAVPFKTTDRGRTWTRVHPGPGFGLATRVAVDPLDGSTVYFLLIDGEVRRTRDGGQTWESAATPGTSPLGTGLLVIDPKNPATLYAPGKGIAKSTDAAATWTHSPEFTDLGFYDLAVAPSSPSTLYGTGAGYHGGWRVVRSLDGGATWTDIEQGVPSVFLSLAVDPLVSTTVYGLLINGNLYKTDNGGEGWSLLGDDFPDNTVLSLAASPTTSGLLYAGVVFDNVYESEDGGGTWEPLGVSPGQEYYLTLLADPTDPCRIYAGTSNHGLQAFTKTGTAECE